MTNLTPNSDITDRFTADLDALIVPGERVGIAVSGGPDSLAFLLLAAAARPKLIEAATVDHALRPESASEAEMVASLCKTLGVPHTTLRAEWGELPASNLQAQARDERYRLLAHWAADKDITAVATAHHADDQAETLLMRLARGAGVAGLAGVRRRTSLRVDGGASLTLIRPLLGWRRAELRAIVDAAGLTPVDDPANADDRFDRTQARELLAGRDWPDPLRLTQSAMHLADAEEALQFLAFKLYMEHHRRAGDITIVEPDGFPREIKRRMLLIGLQRRGAAAVRGPDLDRALAALESGRTVTLGNLMIEGGKTWRIQPAPPRKGTEKRP